MVKTYFASIRAKCITFALSFPLGSIKYRDAKITPRAPPIKSWDALLWATDVSTITHAPRGKSDRQDLSN